MLKRVLISALTVCVCLGVAAPVLAGDFGTVGQKGVVKREGNGFPCFDSKDAFDAYWAAKANGDRYGMADAARDAINLRPGWHVRLLRSEVGFFQGGHSAIRIESGPKAGAACWLKFNPAGIIV
jgi:hypothetical protein